MKRGPDTGPSSQTCSTRSSSGDPTRSTHSTRSKRSSRSSRSSRSIAGLSCSSRSSSLGDPVGSVRSPGGDGSKEDVYLCIRGFVQALQLSEPRAALVVMMTYGLMKGKDLEVLPTTWCTLLMAALRMAVLHVLEPESRSTRAAEKLQRVVEPWHPTWQRDYEAFSQRDRVEELLSSARAAAHELKRSPGYRRATIEWDRKEQPLRSDAPGNALAESDGELASI